MFGDLGLLCDETRSSTLVAASACVAILACNAFFLPYQSTIYLALYNGTGGKLFTHAQARPMTLLYAVATLIALCASVPIWQAWGLM